MHPIDAFAPQALLVLILILAGLILWEPVTNWIRRRRP